ncbi:hypothetical protein [Alishewanella longhuensis]
MLELLPDESDGEKTEEPASREIFIEEFVPNVLVHYGNYVRCPYYF